MGLVLFASAEGRDNANNRLLKDKRTPEEIELLNKAFNHEPIIPIIVVRAGKAFKFPLNYTRER